MDEWIAICVLTNIDRGQGGEVGETVKEEVFPSGSGVLRGSTRVKV